jgi:propanediol dehydratase small subunit
VDELTYPLAASAHETLAAGVTLEAVVDGRLDAASVRTSAETLRIQAGFAERGGNRQLADNLRRGAELAAFDDEELLRFYDTLRPGRATADELETLAETLETRDAPLCAALVREARAAYLRRGLTR